MSTPASYTSPAVVTDLTAAAAAGGGTDYKALVCIFLYGANDAHNTVMPTAANTTQRAQYDFFRSNQTAVGIPANQAPLHPLGASAQWRLHHNLPNLYAEWGAGDLAVLMNVGMMIEPVNRAEYLAKTKRVPPQLFSHNSQQHQWQTLPPLNVNTIHGWFGRAVDLAESYYNPAPFQGIDCAYSLRAGVPQVVGYTAKPNAANATDGFVAPVAPGAYGAAALATTNLTRFQTARASSGWGNAIQDHYASRIASAATLQANLASQLQALPAPADALISGVTVSCAQQLRMVARIINSRTQYAQRRQLFFVGVGGWDDHANLRAGHDQRLADLDTAIGAFWAVMGNLGLKNNVCLFTASDFGRALVQNGSLGVDHGWGGHHFVLGGPVVGGMYGTPPDLTPSSPVDAGQGRLIPTTSVDQYAATLLRWWGIPQQHLPLVIPNLTNFTPTVIPGLLP